MCVCTCVCVRACVSARMGTPPLRVVFFNQIRTAHSVLFHFLMTVQPVSLGELTRLLLLTQ